MTFLDKRKDKIASDALQVFKEKGFIQVSMKDIMESAQVSRGGLYGHFKNIEEVFIHALRIDDEQSRADLKQNNHSFESWVLSVMERNVDLVRAKSEFFLQNNDNDFPYLKERNEWIIKDLVTFFDHTDHASASKDLAHYTLAVIDGILLSSSSDKKLLIKNAELFIQSMKALIK